MMYIVSHDALDLIEEVDERGLRRLAEELFFRPAAGPLDIVMSRFKAFGYAVSERSAAKTETKKPAAYDDSLTDSILGLDEFTPAE